MVRTAAFFVALFAGFLLFAATDRLLGRSSCDCGLACDCSPVCTCAAE